MQCRNCGKNFPIWITIDGKRRNLSSRKNCLECSPFGNGKVIPQIKTSKQISSINKYCKICERLTIRGRKTCNSCYTKIRRHRAKAAAVALLGGKCTSCGWSGNIAGFDFHHINGTKEFNISSVANKAWKIIKKELKKCILLCACCHRIEHSNRDGEKFLEVVEEYSGTLLQ